jgi:hypothetical protein
VFWVYARALNSAQLKAICSYCFPFATARKQKNDVCEKKKVSNMRLFIAAAMKTFITILRAIIHKQYHEILLVNNMSDTPFGQTHLTSIFFLFS